MRASMRRRATHGLVQAVRSIVLDCVRVWASVLVCVCVCVSLTLTRGHHVLTRVIHPLSVPRRKVKDPLQHQSHDL